MWHRTLPEIDDAVMKGLDSHQLQMYRDFFVNRIYKMQLRIFKIDEELKQRKTAALKAAAD